MSLRKIIFMFTLIFLTILSGCSKNDENNPVTPKINEPAQLQLKEITVPSHLQQVQDPHAQMVTGFVQMINGFKNYSTFFSPPSGAKHLPKTETAEDEWTWTEGGLTITLVYNENVNNITWKVILNGNFEGSTVTNWTGMEAEQSKDGSTGHLIIYELGTTTIAAEWDWDFNSTNGSSSFVFIDYDSGNKIQIDENSDKSGMMQIYASNGNQFILEYKITWTSTGSGEWWEYNAAGNVIDSGSWV